MARKKSKLKTPEWILEGYDSKEEYEKAKGIKSKNSKKTFKIRECPKCGSDNVAVVLSGLDSEEQGNTGKEWECKNCGWKGTDIIKKELTEDEFLKYVESKEMLNKKTKIAK